LKTNGVPQDNHFGPLLFNAVTAYSEEKRKWCNHYIWLPVTWWQD
jgi:hypothetical protein